MVSKKEEAKNDFLSSQRSIIFTLTSGIMLGLIIYLGIRFLFYGAISYQIIATNPGNMTLKQYNDHVVYLPAKNSPLKNIFQNAPKGILDINPFALLPFSIYVGFFISYLFSLGFMNEQKHMEKYLYYFLIPPVLGFLLFYLDIRISEWFWILIFLYYVGSPIFIWRIWKKKTRLFEIKNKYKLIVILLGFILISFNLIEYFTNFLDDRIMYGLNITIGILLLIFSLSFSRWKSKN